MHEQQQILPGPTLGAARSSFGEVQPEPENELLWLLRILALRWKLIAVVALLLGGLALAGASRITPSYKATASILIDPEQTAYTDLSGDPGALPTVIWPAQVESYIKVLWSDRLAQEVVRTVGLYAFAEPETPLAPLRVWLRGWALPQLASLRAPTTGPDPAPATLADARPVDAEVQQAVEVFQANLKVEREPLAAVIVVTYQSPDPEIAARVANAAAETFPRELVSAQLSALVATTDYLGQRVTALTAEIDRIESQTQTLQNKLSKSDGTSLSGRRFGELIRAVSEAEAELATMRLDFAADGADGSPLTERLGSAVLNDLRREDLEVGRKLVQTASSLGERHPTMAELQARRLGVRASIRAEEAHIRAQARAEVLVGEKRVALLRDELAGVEKQLALNLGDEVELKRLLTRLESTRQIYQDILARYQRAREQQLMVRPPARVINTARRPATPERRKINLLVAAAAVGSVMAGAAMALLLELRRRGFRAADELASATGFAVCGTLPFVPPVARGGAGSAWRRRIYAQSVSRLALHVVPPGQATGGKGRLILVTSAVPGEGKSVVSLSLARQMADAGCRTLLIDADLHKRTLQAAVDPPFPAEIDLTDLLLVSAASLESALVRDERSGLDLLVCVRPADDPARLLGSQRMAQILAAARARYDVVIVDTPPILAVTDAALIAASADQVLFIVRSEATGRSAVIAAIKELQSFAARPVGLVLNAINLHSYPRHGRTDQLAHYRVSVPYLRTQRSMSARETRRRRWQPDAAAMSTARHCGGES